MLIRIISLVILLNIINVKLLYSVENNEFIYPKDKPSIFKKNILKKKDSSNIITPIKKPIIDINVSEKALSTDSLKKKTNILEKKV